MISTECNERLEFCCHLIGDCYWRPATVNWQYHFPKHAIFVSSLCTCTLQYGRFEERFANAYTQCSKYRLSTLLFTAFGMQPICRAFIAKDVHAGGRTRSDSQFLAKAYELLSHKLDYSLRLECTHRDTDQATCAPSIFSCILVGWRTMACRSCRRKRASWT